MLFGHNTDIKVGENAYHVQTEDRGTGHAIIDTTVYCGGRVVHRRTNSYGDLLPLDARTEAALKSRLDAQHHAVMKELRAGTLELSGISAKSVSAPQARAVAARKSVAHKAIALELLNAKGWLSGGRATLQVAVRDKETGAAIPGARVIARIDGAESAAEFSTATGADGRSQLAFEMPRLSGAAPALVIEARYGESQGSLRFQLRAKPKVPAG